MKFDRRYATAFEQVAKIMKRIRKNCNTVGIQSAGNLDERKHGIEPESSRYISSRMIMMMVMPV